jgi:hypothetical protein
MSIIELFEWLLRWRIVQSSDESQIFEKYMRELYGVIQQTQQFEVFLRNYTWSWIRLCTWSDLSSLERDAEVISLE